MTISSTELRNGILLVGGSAILWSFGGTIARFITASDSWTVVFWRSLLATAFLLAFLVQQHGVRATLNLFTSMRWASYVVGLCFTGASISFVVALSYTSVANILLVQAGVPLFAALLAWIVYSEKPRPSTWVAISAVILGVFIMVSESVTGRVSPIGDGLALLIAALFSVATVITRRHSEVRMTPAVTLGVMVATCISALLAGNYVVSVSDFIWLIAFGAVNLGVGLAMFALGARLIPAALAALIGTLEPVLGPVWVWLVHNEVPSTRTIVGGSVVFLALLTHLFMEWVRGSRNLAKLRTSRSADADRT